ncbi:phosphoheptose isomerase [Burkholderia thailandensis]|nr:phosphoheptose isomerase [Burkholderia thailandensis]
MARDPFPPGYFGSLTNWPARQKSTPAALPIRSACRIISAGKH